MLSLEASQTVKTMGWTNVVSWQVHGRCFRINDGDIFERQVLPSWFRTGKRSSFNRQLRIYGFCRLPTGRDKGGYFHELFLRGKDFLCHRMKRVNKKGTTSTFYSHSYLLELDFYKMPFLPTSNNLPQTGNGPRVGVQETLTTSVAALQRQDCHICNRKAQSSGGTCHGKEQSSGGTTYFEDNGQIVLSSKNDVEMLFKVGPPVRTTMKESEHGCNGTKGMHLVVKGAETKESKASVPLQSSFILESLSMSSPGRTNVSRPNNCQEKIFTQTTGRNEFKDKVNTTRATAESCFVNQGSTARFSCPAASTYQFVKAVSDGDRNGDASWGMQNEITSMHMNTDHDLYRSSTPIAANSFPSCSTNCLNPGGGNDTVEPNIQGCIMPSQIAHWNPTHNAACERDKSNEETILGYNNVTVQDVHAASAQNNEECHLQNSQLPECLQLLEALEEFYTMK